MKKTIYISPETVSVSINSEENILNHSIVGEDYNDIYGGGFDE